MELQIRKYCKEDSYFFLLGFGENCRCVLRTLLAGLGGGYLLTETFREYRIDLESLIVNVEHLPDFLPVLVVVPLLPHRLGLLLSTVERVRNLCQTVVDYDINQVLQTLKTSVADPVHFIRIHGSGF